jgi:hypothetical protein
VGKTNGEGRWQVSYFRVKDFEMTVVKGAYFVGIAN